MNIDDAIEMYQKYDASRGFEDRKYPAVIGVVDGVVAIADEEGCNGSSLTMYRELDFVRWMQRAKEGFENPDNAEYDYDLDEWILNTTPECRFSGSH